MSQVFSLSHYFFNPYAIAHFVVAHLILLWGIFVLVQNKKSIVMISYFLIALNSFLWLVFESMVISSKTLEVARFWAKALYIGVSFLPPSMYFFSVAWLDQLEKSKRWVIFTYLVGLFFVIFFYSTNEFIGAKRHFFGFYDELVGFPSVLYLTFFFVVSGAFFWNLIQGYQKEKNPIKKLHVRRVLIAFVFAFLIGSSEYLTTFGMEFYPIGFVGILILILVTAHAIIRYKLFEIETVIHRTIGWFFTNAAFVIPLAVILYVTGPWYFKLNPMGTWSYLVAVLLVFLFLAKTFQPRADRFFQRGWIHREDVLTKFSEELVHLRGLEELIHKITDTVISTLSASQATVLLYNDRVKKLVTVGAIRNSLKINLQLDPENPFLKWLSKNDRILSRELIQIDPRCEPIREQAESYSRQFDAELCVPLVLNEKLIGLVNLGQKNHRKPYRFLDYQFLNRLRNQATIALSNSLVYDRVEEMVKIRTEELTQTQQQLIQAEKLVTIGALAGGVAHEINNPLAAILTNTQILLMTPHNEDEKESLSLIEQATQRCRDIVKKLMVYSRKPLGGREITEVDFEVVLNTVLSFLTHQMAQESIRVNVKLENRPLVVMGCKNELEQVFTNLLLNSRDAIRAIKKSGEITISMSENSEKITIEIKDDGMGIAPEHLSKIFDPFFTTKDVGKGTGLGLSICQSIIEQHGGTIEVESELGRGATFRVILPKKLKG